MHSQLYWLTIVIKACQTLSAPAGSNSIESRSKLFIEEVFLEGLHGYGQQNYETQKSDYDPMIKCDDYRPPERPRPIDH